MKDAQGHGSDPRGSSGTFGVRLRPKRPTNVTLRTAAQEKAALGRRADSRHFPLGDTDARVRAAVSNAAPFRGPVPAPVVTDKMAASALAQAGPKSDAVPLGSSFAAAKAELERGRAVALPPGVENRRRS